MLTSNLWTSRKTPRAGRRRHCTPTRSSCQSGAALDLNGLHLYAGVTQISGSVINGTIELAPTPHVTGATTGEDVQTTAGLVVTPGPVDASSVTNFQINAITGGTLYLSDGVTPVTSGQFITLAQGAAGLTFTPTAGSLANGSFSVIDSIMTDESGLLGFSATATIAVLSPVPNVTGATTGEDTQTASGLVITPGAVDTSLVTNFQITGITGGSLFLNNGTTPVADGEFITLAQGAAGLTFTPTAGSLTNGSFTVQDSTAANASGLLGLGATATITVLPPVPNVTGATTGENTQTWEGLVVTPGAIDTSLIGDFQINNIEGGKLFLNDGVTPVTDGGFITLAQGAAGLRFTPTNGSLAGGSFTVQDSLTADASGILGDTATATISVVAPTINVPALLYGTAAVSWDGLGLDPAEDTADVTAYSGGQAFPIASNQPVVGTCNWDTTTVPNGQYEICVAFRDASGNVFNQVTGQGYLNNSVAWYSGTITANETWTNSQVNVVDGTVTIASGVTLTVQPGAIVKFVPGASLQIVLQSGATLNAPATQSSPIIFTSFADDTAGGDTNGDGAKSTPQPGDWGGFVVGSGANLNLSPYLQLRYSRADRVWHAPRQRNVAADLRLCSLQHRCRSIRRHT